MIDFKEAEKDQRVLFGQIAEDINDLRREIGEREARLRQLDSLVRIPPRLGERPSFPGAVIETIPDLVVQIEKGRLESEIEQFNARIRALQSQVREAERRIDEARHNWDRSADAYQRYGCREFE